MNPIYFSSESLIQKSISLDVRITWRFLTPGISHGVY